MRTLLFFRGAPGCGKSTIIREAGLQDYALSSDTIRLMVSSPQFLPDGSQGISQKENSEVWNILYKMLEKRMKNGDFTIVDAVNATRSDMNRYKQLASKYRYRVFCVDMTNVPIETCKSQNALRYEYRRVPDYVIDKFYERFKTETVSSGINVISPDELLKGNLGAIGFRPIDLSKYDAIHHIGDIHGCMDPLNEFLGDDGFKENEAYIFTGDFLDRGVQNVEVLKFMMENADKENVFLIEGNHEIHLWKWANDEAAHGKDFNERTISELETAGVSKKEVRKFCRKLLQCAYYNYNDKLVTVTHGGINFTPNVFASTYQYIHGVGTYPDGTDVDNSFYDFHIHDVDENGIFSNYQIHGHRNVDRNPIQVNDTCFNLEGEVEFGGCLRVVTLTPDGFMTREIQNNTFASIDYGEIDREIPLDDIAKVIEALRSTRFINEKKFGNISSFNFSKEAFSLGRWTRATVKARGLFINTNTNQIVARGYEKFFNLEERRETKIENLKKNLKFPLKGYLKENGFLGILGYDEEQDDFFIASKSTPNGDFAGYFKTLLYKEVDADKLNNLKSYLKLNKVSMVFEVIDIDNDPHIIEYDSSHLVLLDVIWNEINFKALPYAALQKVAERFGFKVKQLAYTINTWEEFEALNESFDDPDFKYNEEYVEGFVFEDASGFMFKRKVAYYNKWKKLRTVARAVIERGSYRNAGSFIDNDVIKFYKWLKENRHLYTKDTDIITIRNDYKKAN